MSLPGKEAINAKNVFYYLTYVGAVRLESIEDQQLRRELPHQPLRPQDASLVPSDAPVVLVQLTESPHGSSMLAVSCTQTYSLNRWNIIPANTLPI
eukprot:Em0018g393a